jgi:hypothetical protein
MNEPVYIYDIGWLAVKNCEVKDITKALSFSRLEPTSWQQGLKTVTSWGAKYGVPTRLLDD